MESTNINNRWQKVITLGDQFLARSGHTAISDINNSKIYVFGGSNGTEPMNDVCIFETDTWSRVEFSEEEKALGPKPRMSHAACRDEDIKDRFYIFGGTGKNIGTENYNDLWIFDMSTLKFREILVGKDSAFRPPGMFGHSLNYFNGLLYVFGGTSGFDYFKDIFRFELYSHTWQKL